MSLKREACGGEEPPVAALLALASLALVLADAGQCLQGYKAVERQNLLGSEPWGSQIHLALLLGSSLVRLYTDVYPRHGSSF